MNFQKKADQFRAARAGRLGRFATVPWAWLKPLLRLSQTRNSKLGFFAYRLLQSLPQPDQLFGWSGINLSLLPDLDSFHSQVNNSICQRWNLTATPTPLGRLPGRWDALGGRTPRCPARPCPRGRDACPWVGCVPRGGCCGTGAGRGSSGWWDEPAAWGMMFPQKGRKPEGWSLRQCGRAGSACQLQFFLDCLCAWVVPYGTRRLEVKKPAMHSAST